MPSCSHDRFEAEVEVTQLVEHEGGTEPTGWAATVKVKCADCDAPFGFKGLESGVSLDAPMRSLDALLVHLPLMSPAELALAGPFPPHEGRMPDEVATALEELSRSTPVTRLDCSEPIREAQRQGGGLFMLRDVGMVALDPPTHVIVVDPEGWRLYGRVRERTAAGNLLIEAKTAWRPS